MRRATLALPIALAASACQKEASFDERYDRATQELNSMAAKLDADFANQAALSNEAAAAMAPEPASP